MIAEFGDWQQDTVGELSADAEAVVSLTESEFPLAIPSLPL